MTPARDRAQTIEDTSTDWLLSGVVAVVCCVGLILRFLPRSALWLDEALSVNIAALPLGDIPQALRHDGHPPLYYALLHLWMKVAGTSDTAVRALSAVFSSLTLPLAYLAGRRMADREGPVRMAGREDEGRLDPHQVGLISVAVIAAMPFANRYGSEARMYALVMLLVVAGYLLVTELLTQNPKKLSLGRSLALGVAGVLVTGALLWTHYWTLWLLAATGLMTVAIGWKRWRNSARKEFPKGPLVVVVSLVLGGLTFIPWLPTMMFQAEHTGTPWGARFGPVSVAVLSLIDFAGGRFGVAQFLSYFLVMFIVAAAALSIRKRPVDPGSSSTAATKHSDELVVTDWLHRRVRPELVMIVMTLGIGWATARVSGNTFASRYAAVVFPVFVIVVAAGIALIRSPRIRAASVAAVCVMALFGSVGAAASDRTQAGRLVDRLERDLARHPGPAVVVACPDQLGVSLQRQIDARPAVQAVVGDLKAYPLAGNPRFVDWVDYAQRNEASDPVAFTKAITDGLDDAATIYLVVNAQYRSLETKCVGLIDSMAGLGQMELLETTDTTGLDEAAELRVIRRDG